MFAILEHRQRFERLVTLFEAIHTRPLTSEELVEFNMIYKILQESAEFVNNVMKSTSFENNSRVGG